MWCGGENELPPSPYVTKLLSENKSNFIPVNKDESNPFDNILKTAFVEIAKNNFKKPTKKLARDHQVTRADTYAQIFGAKKYEFNDWWNLVWENDKTTLITNDEHNTHMVSEIYPIDLELGLFRDSGMVGWSHTLKSEGAFVKSLCEKHNINY